MPHKLRLAGDDVADDVTLTLGMHPDGELAFEDSTATVDDEALAQQLAGRYARIEYSDEAAETAEAGETTEESDETPDEEEGNPPIDPSEYTIDDLEDTLAEAEYSAAELEAIREAEQAEKDRNGAISVIEDALEE